MSDTWPPRPERDEIVAPPSPDLSAWKRFWRWMYHCPSGRRPALSILWWWEKRRIAYNVVVGGIGIVSLIIFTTIMVFGHKLKPGEDAVEPMSVLLAPIAMNICYSIGWLADLVISRIARDETGRVGSVLLEVGVWFSIVLVCLPTVIAAFSVVFP